MTKPATDEDLERIRRKLDRIPMPVRLELEYDVAALLARIHKEQEDRKTVEDLCRSIRHVTIKECAAILSAMDHDPDPYDDYPLNSAENAILALLEVRK